MSPSVLDPVTRDRQKHILQRGLLRSKIRRGDPVVDEGSPHHGQHRAATFDLHPVAELLRLGP